MGYPQKNSSPRKPFSDKRKSTEKNSPKKFGSGFVNTSPFAGRDGKKSDFKSKPDFGKKTSEKRDFGRKENTRNNDFEKKEFKPRSFERNDKDKSFDEKRDFVRKENTGSSEFERKEFKPRRFERNDRDKKFGEKKDFFKKESNGEGFEKKKNWGSRESFSSRRTSFGGNRPSFSNNRRGSGNRGGGRFRNQKEEGLNWTYYVKKATGFEIDSPYDFEKKFEEYDIPNEIKRNLDSLGFINPTKIQVEIMPKILDGNDVLGIAQTGSGKTGAFLIPIIQKLMENKKNRCLIVVPTRELANQIQEDFKNFTKNISLKSVLVIGGSSIFKQKMFLRNNPEIVVGTPGRLKDLNNQKILNLKNFNMVVLDEVDRMLDMGFIDDIKFLISNLSSPRQSMFFSATLDKVSEQIANDLLSNPIKVQIQSIESHKNVDQDIVRVSSHTEKIDTLHDLLIQKDFLKVLVFSKTKSGADKLSKELFYRGFKVDAIHGDKSQFKRQKAVDKFKRSEINILVATDVVARGIDIKDVSHVINFDEPATYEDYIHRIGRTGRIGKKGIALTFVIDKKH